MADTPGTVRVKYGNAGIPQRPGPTYRCALRRRGRLFRGAIATSMRCG